MHLPFVVNCTEVCAVKINLHELLLENRKEAVEEGNASWSEKFAWKIWKAASLRRGMMNMGSRSIKNRVVNKILKVGPSTGATSTSLQKPLMKCGDRRRAVEG
jgi:L-lactate utilization protein LutB